MIHRLKFLWTHILMWKFKHIKCVERYVYNYSNWNKMWSINVTSLFAAFFIITEKSQARTKNENNVCTNFRYSSTSKPTGCHSLFSQWELMSNFFISFWVCTTVEYNWINDRAIQFLYINAQNLVEMIQKRIFIAQMQISIECLHIAWDKLCLLFTKSLINKWKLLISLNMLLLWPHKSNTLSVLCIFI